MPRVRVQPWNLSQEAKLFVKFINHADFPTHRRMIFSSFPELHKLFSATGRKGEQRIVKAFLRRFHKTHAVAITTIYRRERLLIEKRTPQALRALSRAMEYSWRKKVTYVAIPTLLPFSPFGTNRFYFSILGILNNKKGGLNRLQVAIHEISHFIFFNILWHIEQEKKITLPRDALHLFKESLTAALFNEAPLRQALKIQEYHGNPEVQALYVKIENRKKPVLLTDYIRRLYRLSKRKKKPLYETLSRLVVSAYHSRVAFARKRALWNRYGRKILLEPRLKVRYKVPISFGE